ncbi:MAG: hypothetical protein K2N74_00820, partial [Clostridiales bacterium]|nr:hypothetical protein [Clostridiales bacterium]
KCTLCYLLGAAAILFFLAVFYGVFSDIAIRQIFAFAKISKYFAGISLLGRIDFIFIYAITLVMAFYCTLPIHAGIDCIVNAFKTREGERSKLLIAILTVGVNLVFLILSLFMNYTFRSLNEAVTQTVFWIFPLFALLVPLLALALRRSPRAKAK